MGQPGQIGTIKGLGAVFCILTGVMAIYVTTELKFGSGISGLMPVILAALGIVLGIVGAFSPVPKKPGAMPKGLLFLGMSAAFLILTMAFAPPSDILVDTSQPPIMNSPVEFITTLLFGFFFVSYIEFIHGGIRFAILYENASKSIEGFDLSPVLKRFLGMFFVMMGAAFVFALVVVNMTFGLAMISPEPLAHSIELGSVFGVGMALTIVFVPIGIMFTFVLGKDRAEMSRKEKTSEEGISTDDGAEDHGEDIVAEDSGLEGK